MTCATCCAWRLVEMRSQPPPSTMVGPMQSTPESGGRAGYDGHKRRKGSKVHLAVDTLGHLLALHVTPANEQERAQVAELSRQVQEITGDHIEIAFVDQGYTGDNAQTAAAEQGIQLEVVKLSEAKRGFVLLPRRWVVETLAGLHFVAFAILMLNRLVRLAIQSS